MGYELRPYQKECIEAIDKMQSNKPGLVVLSTGSGKTVIMADVSARNEGRTLVVVISSELRQQTIDKLLQTDSSLDIGSVQGTLDQVSNKIVVSTRQSLTHGKSTRIQRMLTHGEFGLIIFDECHVAVSQISKIISKLGISESKVIGLTATPFSRDISNVFKEIIYSKDILYMLDNGYLCEPKVIQVSTNTSLKEVKTVAGEFNSRDLERTINTNYRNDLIVKAFKKFAPDRLHTLVFCSGIEHCADLTKEFNSQGVKCSSIDSTLSTKEREKVLEDYNNGVIDILCNVGVLTVGFDNPQTDCIIYARPTKSKILFTQILGRGLRLFPGKDDCLVLDFLDVVNNHDLMANMDSLFDVEFKSGQKLSEAREDKKNEDTAKKIEKEKVQREKEEQLELIAKQIKLFNREMNRAFQDVSYDWFKCTPSVYAVCAAMDEYQCIESGDNEFLIYNINTGKTTKSIDFVDAYENVTDAIKYVEDNIKNPRSFAYKDSSWKQDLATEKQRAYVKWAKTKWQVSCYFASNTIKSMLRSF